MLLNTPYDLPHILERSSRQRLRILEQSHPKSAYCNLLVAFTNFIVKLLILIGITTKGFADPYLHR